MTGSGESRTRGRPIDAVLAVVWLALGFWAIEDGEMWRGAATVALAALWASSYWWPGSPIDRFLKKPLWRRKKSEELSAPGRG